MDLWYASIHLALHAETSALWHCSDSFLFPLLADRPSEGASYAPDFVDLMQDIRVQNVVHQMVTNPAFLRAAMPNIAANPELRSVCACVRASSIGATPEIGH